MTKKRHNNIEYVGVSAVQKIIFEELDWIFRPVPPPDVGLDATIEQKLNDEPTAKLLGVQLKTGLGNFS